MQESALFCMYARLVWKELCGRLESDIILRPINGRWLIEFWGCFFEKRVYNKTKARMLLVSPLFCFSQSKRREGKYYGNEKK